MAEHSVLQHSVLEHAVLEHAVLEHTGPGHPGNGYAFDALGTRWRIVTDRPVPVGLRRRVAATVADFDRRWSRFRPDSAVSELARRGGTLPVPPEDRPLVALYRALYCASDGAVTPLVGGTLERLGYDATLSLHPLPGPTRVPRWHEVFAGTDDRPDRAPDAGDPTTDDPAVLRLRRPALLDVGAAGKGHLADRVLRLLTDEGFTEVLVDASGDLAHRGPVGCPVALEDPRDVSRAVGVALLRDGGLASSATNRRRWVGGRHHVIDAATAAPAAGTAATWVVAASAALADGLATALFVADPDRLRQWFAFEYLRLTDTGTAEWSRGFPGEVFTR